MAKSEVLNIDKLKKKLGKLATEFEDLVEKEIKTGVLIIHSMAVQSIQAHESQGRTYGKHTASAPGNPPNTDTGRLVSSIKFDVKTDSEGTVGVVGTNLFYGPMLEFGTSKMKARPWLGPAFNRHAPDVVKRIQAAANKLLRKAKKEGK
jgi:HK97 gp10 family phage protein